VRVEELMPFPVQDLATMLSKYNNAKQVVWCQEEPQNMGAYGFMEPRLRQMLPGDLKVQIARFDYVSIAIYFIHYVIAFIRWSTGSCCTCHGYQLAS
jgi:hypothetical protein